MKKLLSLLGAIGLVATSSATVVSCDNGDKDSSNAGDFTADFSTWTSEEDIENAVTENFKNNEAMKDATVMVLDTIDDVNKAEGILGGNGEKDMPVFNADKKDIKDLKSVAFLAFTGGPTEADPAATATTVLKGTITNKPEEKTGITLDKAEVSIAIDDTDTVTISNFTVLTNVKAESADIATATAELADDGTIAIKGVAKGSTTITVSADGVDSVTITVTVKAADEKTTISLDKDSVEIEAETTDTVTISNFTVLTNVKAESADTATATAELADDGTIAIKGVAKGSTTITVSADGVDSVTITVTVKAAK
jgi:hypothetical protein